MNKSVDETDRTGPGVISNNITSTSTTTTITGSGTAITNNLDHLNNKLNINNNITTIDHPLNLIKNNNENLNNNVDDNIFSDDMTEINLKSPQSTDLNNSNDNNNKLKKEDTRKKINWVKFDDDDSIGDDVGDNNNGNITTLTTVESTINNNKFNSSNNNISNLDTDTQLTTKLPPPPQINKVIINSPVSSTPHQLNKTLPSTSSDIGAAVLATESVHINLNNSSISSQKPNSTTTNPNNISTTTTTTSATSNNNGPKSVSISISTPAPPMRTIELSTGRIREGFANGDVIVTLLPTNTKLPWITPAVFRPELVPEELMAQGLTLTVEEYVNAMETLVNDFRFTVYNICYKRVLMCWILFAFCVLLTLLFSGMQGIALFSLGVAWLFLNAAAIFLCMWVKLRLSRGLEKCLARVNKQLLRHKILLILDDRGRISCHKVNLCFMYFDPALCIAYLNEFIERHEQNGTSIQAGWEKKLDLDVNDIVIQGSNPVRLSRKQALAQEIFLTYLQRWGKDFIRRRLDWTVNEAGVHETPRHLMSSICPCQYEEEEKSMLLYLRYASRWGNEIVRGLGDVSVTEPARHCANFICPCQYIERHLACKPRDYPCSCCAYLSDPNFQYRY